MAFRCYPSRHLNPSETDGGPIRTHCSRNATEGVPYKKSRVTVSQRNDHHDRPHQHDIRGSPLPAADALIPPPALRRLRPRGQDQARPELPDRPEPDRADPPRRGARPRRRRAGGRHRHRLAHRPPRRPRRVRHHRRDRPHLRPRGQADRRQPAERAVRLRRLPGAQERAQPGHAHGLGRGDRQARLHPAEAGREPALRHRHAAHHQPARDGRDRRADGGDGAVGDRRADAGGGGHEGVTTR